MGLATGQQFAYEYDDIGNRHWAKSGGNASGANQRQTDYTANALNQYSAIANPRSFDVLVRSPEVVGVKSGTSTFSVVDQGTYNRAEVTTTASTAQWMPVEVAADNTPLSRGNVWLPAASVAPQHDADGNLIHDGRWDYVWDGENRLVSMRPTAAAVTAGAPNIGLDFRYDHRSRRIAKKVIDLGNNNAVLSDLRFCYDGWNLAAEFSAGSNNTLTLLRSCTWGPDLSNTLRGAGGVGGLLAVRVGEADYYPCFDGNGNIIAWSDAAGSVRRRVDYDPFGNVTAVENTATGMPVIPFGFSTKYTDAETGLLYYIHRYYHPVMARWLSQDPIGEEGGLNLYGFVGNEGIGHYDYLGQDVGQPKDDFDHRRAEARAAEKWQVCPPDLVLGICHPSIKPEVQAAIDRSEWGNQDRWHEEGGWVTVERGVACHHRATPIPGERGSTRIPAGVPFEYHTHPPDSLGATVLTTEFKGPDFPKTNQDHPTAPGSVVYVVDPVQIWRIHWEKQCKSDGTVVKWRVVTRSVETARFFKVPTSIDPRKAKP